MLRSRPYQEKFLNKYDIHFIANNKFASVIYGTSWGLLRVVVSLLRKTWSTATKENVFYHFRLHQFHHTSMEH